MKVSVLIPVCRAEAHIARAVSSLLLQTYVDWEAVIAVDDGRDYVNILKSHGIVDERIHQTFTKHPRSGPSAARNAAIDAANGEVYALLDADDTMHPEKLAKLAPMAMEYGVACSDIQLIRSDTNEVFSSHHQKYAEGLLGPADLMKASFHSFAHLVWNNRRVALRFDESIKLAEDVIFATQCFNFIEHAYYTPAVLHSYYKDAGSTTNERDIARHFIRVYHALLHDLEKEGLDVKNREAKEALVRFTNVMLDLEHYYLEEQNPDPVMGFYHFLGRHKQALYTF